MRKHATLPLITILTIATLTILESASAQSTPNPSVPEFTMTYIDLSYYVQPTYGIDQFTGENVTKQEGYHVDKQSVTFKIKNQPFTSYNDSSGHNISLYYNFKYKGHFGNKWLYYPFSDSGQGTFRYSGLFIVFSYESPKLAASNSEYTEITLSLPFLFGVENPTAGSKVDFQIQALTGHIDYEGDGFYRYEGQSSEWSTTQTITVGQSDSSATPNAPPLQDSTTPEQKTETTEPTPSQTTEPVTNGNSQTVEPWVIAGTVLSVVLVSAGLLVYFKKRKFKGGAQ